MSKEFILGVREKPEFLGKGDILWYVAHTTCKGKAVTNEKLMEEYFPKSFGGLNTPYCVWCEKLIPKDLHRLRNFLNKLKYL